jgi:hypothetical protein
MNRLLNYEVGGRPQCVAGVSAAMEKASVLGNRAGARRA